MKELEAYRRIMAALPAGCSAAEAEAEKHERISVEVTAGKTGRMSCSEQTELFVRASGERTGLVYTQKLDANPTEVIEQALSNSLVSASENAEPMALPEYWSRIQPKGERFSLVPAGELKETALRLEKELKAELDGTFGENPKVLLTLSQEILTMGIVNSNGVDVCAQTNRFTTDVMIDDSECSFSAFEPGKLSARAFAAQINLRRFAKQPLIRSEAGVYRAVLSSNAVNNILITAWQLFSGKRAESGATPLAGKVGEQIFSKCITIRDCKGAEDSRDPVPCGFSWEMDCEGVPSEDVTLVENGVLKGWMHNLATALRAGCKSTGNAGRRTSLSGNIHTDVAVMPKNFTIESGEEPLEELIRECGDGVYVFENYDEFHALNAVTGDFSFPCRAVRIQKGMPIGVMEGLTMSGNVKELFAKVEKLGSDRAIMPMVMYESYTVSGPAMLVESLRISG